MTLNEMLDIVVELAQEMAVEDPLDFDGLGVQEHTTTRMIASTVLERDMEISDPKLRELTLLATATHLVTENFALNRRLLSQK